MPGLITPPLTAARRQASLHRQQQTTPSTLLAVVRLMWDHLRPIQKMVISILTCHLCRLVRHVRRKILLELFRIRSIQAQVVTVIIQSMLTGGQVLQMML